ncbi:UBX domain-containing protein 1 [Hondaea fermentalgiana]|uniref:UBX domain-containing protein 1 n=1 Tax=Hondaea fermentalgiana TaxID=2315210 RepID=A0A2R5GVE8_9STRA|nr:UBX domain-containing protein 1 [Hondaea fermentalgiana]|eukprot:GBG34817.1 UBX domain-containing protein 1 [Hondaea fermentalgiana]
MGFFTEGNDLQEALQRLRADPLRPLVLVLAASNLRGGSAIQDDVEALETGAVGPSLRETRRVRVEGSRAMSWFRAHFKIRSLCASVIMTGDGWFEAYEGKADLEDLERRANRAMQELSRRVALGLAMARAVEALYIPNGRRVGAKEWACSKRYAKLEGVCSVVAGRRAPILSAQDNFEVSVRLLDGARVASRFEPHSLLQDVANFVQECCPGEVVGETLHLGTAFPRKIFTHEDYANSLRDLGLAKNCLLVMYQGAVQSANADMAPYPFAALLVWLAALWAYVLRVLGFREPPRQISPFEDDSATSGHPPATSSTIRTMRDLREPATRESEQNEYFGGDSTVFQGGEPDGNDADTDFK